MSGQGTVAFTHEGIKQFHRWTHRSLDALVDHLATLPEELLTKELDGFGFKSVQGQLVHLLECEAAWVRDLQGLAFEPWQPSDFSTAQHFAQHCGESKKQVRAATLAYLDGLSPEALEQEVTMTFEDGRSLSRTPAEVLHHILTHAYHHKGQIAAMCRLLGHPTPDTDLLH